MLGDQNNVTRHPVAFIAVTAVYKLADLWIIKVHVTAASKFNVLQYYEEHMQGLLDRTFQRSQAIGLNLPLL